MLRGEKEIQTTMSRNSNANAGSGVGAGLMGAAGMMKSLAKAGLGSMLGGAAGDLLGNMTSSAFGSTIGGAVGSIGGNALSGAAMGSIAGPIGTAVGAAVGGLTGAIKSYRVYTMIVLQIWRTVSAMGAVLRRNGKCISEGLKLR